MSEKKNHWVNTEAGRQRQMMFRGNSSSQKSPEGIFPLSSGGALWGLFGKLKTTVVVNA